MTEPARAGWSRRTTTVVDATETEHRDAPLPTTVSELESLGFRVIGRLAVRTVASRADYLYDAGERRRLAVWRARPAATLLAADDGTSYATVDTFGDAPVVRLRTELTDGSLVETVGIPPVGAPIPRDGTSPFVGFTLSNAPGRSVRLTPTADVGTALDEHAQHRDAICARRGAAAGRHVNRADALRLWRAATAHADACSQWLDDKARWWGRAILALVVAGLALVVVGLLAALRAESALDSLLLFLAVFLGEAVLGVLLGAARIVRHRHLRRARLAAHDRPGYPLDSSSTPTN